MILPKPIVAKIRAGEKTAHVLPADVRKPPRPADVVPVHVAVGHRSSCRVEVLSVAVIRLGELRDDDAVEQGFTDLEALVDWWAGAHGAWSDEASVLLVRFQLDRQLPNRQTTDGTVWTDGEAPLVDGAWEDAEAVRRRGVHQDRLGDLAQRRAAGRGRLSIGERLDRVLTEAAAMSTAPALRYGPKVSSPSGHGSLHLVGNPLGEVSDVVDVDRHLFVISRRVEELERELDVARGVAEPVRGATGSSPGGTGRRLMDQAMYDRLLTDADCVGRRPEELSEAMPYLGSPRTIRRRRGELGLRGVDGRPREERAA